MIGLEGVEYRKAASPAPDAAAVCAHEICEDFEKGLTGTRSENASVDVGAGRTSKSSLRSKVATASDANGSIVRAIEPRGAGSKLVVRGWFRLTAPLSHGSLIELRHPYEAQRIGGISVKIFGDDLTFDVTDSTGASRASNQPKGAAPAVGTWTCIRLVVDVAKQGRITIQRDADTVADVSLDTILEETAWDAVSIGLPFAKDAQGLEVFTDDVLVSDRPVTCAEQ